MDPQPESVAPNFPAPATEAPATKPPNNIAAGYLALAEKIRQSGLQRRRRWYYITLFTVLLALFAAAWTGFSLLGNSWYQLLIASAIGALFTQFAFLSHEAAHHQVFQSKRVNEWAARLVGTSLVGKESELGEQRPYRRRNQQLVPAVAEQGESSPGRGKQGQQDREKRDVVPAAASLQVPRYLIFR